MNRRSRGSRRRLVLATPVLAVLVSGCGVQDLPRFGWPSGITPQALRMESLWKGSVVAALAVGAFVLALILWACFSSRKRNDDLPRQVRYNMPIEVLYTVVPFLIIASLFWYTARDETYVDRLSASPQVTVHVVGVRWNWLFSYEVQQNGRTVELPAEVGQVGQPATLTLPTDMSVRFVETSPDVIHSFWVPAFLFKRDVIPGRVNQFEISKILRTGTFIGRCAELCGVDHDQMDFFVHVVTPDQFRSYMSNLERTTPGNGVNVVPPRDQAPAQAVGPLSVPARRSLGTLSPNAPSLLGGTA